MNYPEVEDHPPSDTLMDYALGGAVPGVEEHCAECPACSRYVSELRDVKEVLVGLPEQQAPAELRKKIMTTAVSRGRPWFAFSAQHLLRSPVAVGLGAVLVVLFLYVFFVFVV